MIVEVYKNVHLTKSNACEVYSVRSVKSKKVLFHTKEIQLLNASFRVSAKGRARVLVTGQKNVHACIRGEIAPEPKELQQLLIEYDKGFLVTYNPRILGSFFRREAQEPIYKADFVVIKDDNVMAYLWHDL